MEKQNIVSAHIDIDTTEAKANVEELTLAINECVSAFEKLEKVMNKYTGAVETVELYLDGEAIARTTAQDND
ncbi:hypothetical protein ACTFRD_30525 [Bacillus cereus group sp. MYBK249-1]|uniref:Uncharacterized protein n=1 Tax=Bacillus thuringiensis serovar iberica TaxID=180866 RepID=A0A9X6LUN5_BACTU|nr:MULTISPECIES: hypothetical protein [Bacillus cereus group]HDR5353025.1 hypothetical protein [Bacillus thuringiensis]MCU5026514.1 hypothetical protein [Bacillus cereus]MDF9519684.1 hypothetical protein [Bacillus cereus]MDF9563393.1 hypothetical protein [Bacillus cereus]MEB9624342.1 hypothetical protein [Bacillus cereus]